MANSLAIVWCPYLISLERIDEMSLDMHRQAERFMGLADRAHRDNQPEEAAQLNCQAAELEAQVVEMLPADRHITRGIIAISSVALYRKAGAFEQAIRQARTFLEREDLPESARLDLQDLITALTADLA